MTHLKNIFLPLLAFFIINVNAQTKKTTSTKSAKPEIDKLYEKYKDSKQITLFTPHGDLIGDVYINFNDDDKPVSINIHGADQNKAAIAEFISNTIKMKLKQGYDITKPTSFMGALDSDLIERELGYFELLMRKGNMYFKVNTKPCEKYNLDSNGNIDFANRDCGYTWEIETGDTKRQGGKKATKFEF